MATRMARTAVSASTFDWWVRVMGRARRGRGTLGRLAQVSLEPVEHSLVAVLAAVGSTGDREGVCALRIEGELDLAAECAEGQEELDVVAWWAAVVVLSLEDEQWRSDLVGQAQRRLHPEASDPGRRQGLGDAGPAVEVGARVGERPARPEVGHPTVRDGRGEPIWVRADQPVHEVAAVREPDQTDPPRVGQTIGDEVVEDRHHVLVVDLAPAVTVGTHPIGAVPGRPADVGSRDEEAGLDEDAHLEPRRWPPGPERAAMEVDDQGEGSEATSTSAPASGVGE